MSKERAFVRYTKSGKIVPGSLILTKGSYPSGPALWKEITIDLCCEGAGGCVEFEVSLTEENPAFPGNGLGIIISLEAYEGTTFTIDFGDGTIISEGVGNYVRYSNEYFYSQVGIYNVKICFDKPSLIKHLQIDVFNDSVNGITNVTGIQKLNKLEDLELDYAFYPSIDVSNFLLLTELDVSNNPNLTFLGINNLPSLEELDIDGTALSGSIDLTSYPNLYRFNLSGCDFTSIDASNLTSLQFISASNNSNLTSVNISNTPLLIFVSMSGCDLPEAVVDSILIELDNAGLLSGTVDLSGGTSAAPSVGPGAAAAANLIAKLWNVTTN